MDGVTQAVNDLAQELGATVDWDALHSNSRSAPVAALIAAAAIASFADSWLREHQQDINAMLDGARADGGFDESLQPVATALADMSLTLFDQRQAAIERTRTLIIPLTELGVLQMGATDR
ncbi:hypothetical protein [Micromonospora sp. C95]|uniref:hypothetical protein n=1 Tax=Micromonospora sp. C95 TaxID=2824882 RepID=UPI001B35F4BA|nr:hypothetical protein [Micromonospora sp. C95]MBQ1022782.1 hypothetical protein [Micromonospora sp. C95]